MPVREAEPFDIRSDIMNTVRMGMLAVIFDCIYDASSNEIKIKRSFTGPYLPPNKGTAEGYFFTPLVTIPRNLSRVILSNGEERAGFIEMTDKVELYIQLIPQLTMIDDEYVALTVYAKRTVVCRTRKYEVQPWLFDNEKMQVGLRSTFDVSPITVISFNNRSMVKNFTKLKVTGDLEQYLVEGDIQIDHKEISLKLFSE